ncbi:hypothetical protein DM01DRAFT_1379727 [Hesseltinella vesiculosa]|uniref:Poly(A) RNA polymerase mitochondrial-like central palm domain-containing protein n=1 Tax=Hesseltinella vesiculosa TaxID=101127 RepID=A0A1X2GYR2_9FUNG|nr:hypothetical protein DM01DRAFT_1379727 [Hesseltinella vesiculosa]
MSSSAVNLGLLYCMVIVEQFNLLLTNHGPNYETNKYLSVITVESLQKHMQTVAPRVHDLIVNSYGTFFGFINSQAEFFVKSKGITVNCSVMTAQAYKEFGNLPALPDLESCYPDTFVYTMVASKDLSLCGYTIEYLQRTVEPSMIEMQLLDGRQPTHIGEPIFNTARFPRLLKEINRLHNALQPDPATLVAHFDLISKLNSILSIAFPGQHYRVEPFGSSLNGLLLKGSDIDLTIVLPNDQKCMDKYLGMVTKNGTIFDVHHLTRMLTEVGMTDVNPIPAVVPICKFLEPKSGLRCDLSIHNMLAISNSRLIKAYIDMDKRVKPLLFMIKHFTKERCINNAAEGTLSSYTYSMLCLNYLIQENVLVNLQNPTRVTCTSTRCHLRKKVSNRKFLYRDRVSTFNTFYHDCIKPVYRTGVRRAALDKENTLYHSHNKCDVAKLLIGFFEFMAIFRFDLISIPTHLRRHILRKDSLINPIVVYDPFIRSRNVANTCTNIGLKLIQNEFARGYRMMVNGSSFEQVCMKPNLANRRFDPDTVRNRHELTASMEEQTTSSQPLPNRGFGFIGANWTTAESAQTLPATALPVATASLTARTVGTDVNHTNKLSEPLTSTSASLPSPSSPYNIPFSAKPTTTTSPTATSSASPFSDAPSPFRFPPDFSFKKEATPKPFLSSSITSKQLPTAASLATPTPPRQAPTNGKDEPKTLKAALSPVRSKVPTSDTFDFTMPLPPTSKYGKVQPVPWPSLVPKPVTGTTTVQPAAAAASANPHNTFTITPFKVNEPTLEKQLASTNPEPTANPPKTPSQSKLPAQEKIASTSSPAIPTTLLPQDDLSPFNNGIEAMLSAHQHDNRTSEMGALLFCIGLKYMFPESDEDYQDLVDSMSDNTCVINFLEALLADVTDVDIVDVDELMIVLLPEDEINHESVTTVLAQLIVLAADMFCDMPLDEARSIIREIQQLFVEYFDQNEIDGIEVIAPPDDFIPAVWDDIDYGSLFADEVGAIAQQAFLGNLEEASKSMPVETAAAIINSADQSLFASLAALGIDEDIRADAADLLNRGKMTFLEQALQIPVQLAPEQSKAQARTQADTKAKTEAKSQAKSPAKQQAKAQTKAQTKAQAKAQAKAQVKAQAKAQVKAQAKVHPKAQAKAEPKTQTNVQPNVQSKALPKEQAVEQSNMKGNEKEMHLNHDTQPLEAPDRLPLEAPDTLRLPFSHVKSFGLDTRLAPTIPPALSSPSRSSTPTSPVLPSVTTDMQELHTFTLCSVPGYIDRLDLVFHLKKYGTITMIKCMAGGDNDTWNWHVAFANLAMDLPDTLFI